MSQSKKGNQSGRKGGCNQVSQTIFICRKYGCNHHQELRPASINPTDNEIMGRLFQSIAQSCENLVSFSILYMDGLDQGWQIDQLMDFVLVHCH